MTGEYSAFVVDDEPGLLRFFEKFLTRRSIAATTFATAEACLEAMRNTNLEHSAVPDLVLIDLDLGSGRMQGHELVARLNNMDVPSELVVMSGVASMAAIEDAINVGAGYYIAKPFDVASLGPTLGRLADIGNGRRTYRM
ncbi:MAG TPA: response regulator, partial [Polyangiaceae bacterium]